MMSGDLFRTVGSWRSCLSLSVLVLLVLHVASAMAPAALPADSPPCAPDWVRHAKIAGLSLTAYHVTTYEITCGLDDREGEAVDAVRVTSRLMDYATDLEFLKELDLVGRVTKDAAQKRLKVLWTVPVLGYATAEGRIEPHSIGRIHPDWLMRSFDRHKKAVGYPKRPPQMVHRDEVVGFCPNGPYRAFFLDRLRKVAATPGLDGIWLSSIDLEGPGVFWPCADLHCREKFRRETGMEFPSSVDLSSARFKRFVQWRHEMLAELVSECARSVRQVNPKLVVVAEVGSVDNGEVARSGLDGSLLKDVIVAWDLPSISSTTGMADARIDDWLSQLVAYRWCRGASGGAPAWGFCRGFQSEDVQLLLAGCLAAQVNPYETKGSQPAVSTGSQVRRIVYEWASDNQSRLFGSTSLSRVAVVFSPASRDLLDGIHHGGQFSGWCKPRRDMVWFATSPWESEASAEYVGEYRGWAKLLVRSGIPFDVIMDGSLERLDLGRYRCLILPEAAILSDAAQKSLSAWTAAGGTLVVSGPHSCRFGPDRPHGASAVSNGLSNGTGRVISTFDPLGRQILKGDLNATATAKGWLTGCGVAPLVAEGTPVYVQAYQHGNETLVHSVHYGWAGDRNRSPTTVRATYEIPISSQPRSVRVWQSAPGRDAIEIPASVGRGRVRFTADVLVHALFVIQAQ